MNTILPKEYDGQLPKKGLPSFNDLSEEERRLLTWFYIGIRFLDFSMTIELEKFLIKFKQEAFSTNLNTEYNEMVRILQAGVKHLKWRNNEAEEDLKVLRIRRRSLRDYIKLERDILLVSIQIALGKHQATKSKFKETLSMAKVLNTTWREIMILVRHGLYHFTVIDVSSALERLEMAYQKLNYDDPQLEMLILNNLGVGYRLAGEYEKSIEFFKKGIEIQERIAKPSNYLRMLIFQNFAIMLLGIHRYREAIQYIEKSISEINLSNEHPLLLDQFAYGIVLLIQAHFLNGTLKHIPSAFERLEEAKPRLLEGGQIGAMLSFHLAEALVELSRGNIFSTNVSLLKLLETLETIPDKKRYYKVSWFSWNLLIYTNFMLFQINNNPKYLEEATEKITRLEQSFSIPQNPIAKGNIILLRSILACLSKSDNLEIKAAKVLLEELGHIPQLHDFFSSLEKAIQYSFRLPLVESLKEIVYIVFYSNLTYYDIARLEIVEAKVHGCGLYKFGDLGPELVYYKGAEFALSEIQRTGVFLISLIGIGDKYLEGFWGPLPTSIEGFLGYVVTKVVKDSRMSDPRMAGHVYTALVFFIPDHANLYPEDVHNLRAVGRRFYEEIDDLSKFSPHTWEDWTKKHLGL